MIVTPRHHPHEAGFGLQRHGPAIGGEREARHNAIQASSLGLVRGLADHHQFRVGKAHRRNCRWVEFAGLAADQFGNHFALDHGPVRQHRLATEVANGVHVAHAGLAAAVDLDRRAVHVQVQRFEVPALGVGFAPHGDQHLVGVQRQGVAIGCTYLQLVVGKAGDAVFQVQLHAEFLQGFSHRQGQFGVVGRQNVGLSLDHTDVGTQLAVGNSQFQADITTAHHDQALGHVCRC